MADPFLIVAITFPGWEAEWELRAIVNGLDSGRFGRVHIRKDSPDEATRLLQALPGRLYSRLSLHNARPQDIAAFPGIGVHLTGRTPVVPDGFSGTLSRSCHTLEEAETFIAAGGNYAFLSPVFDSISKPGYHSAFTLETLAKAGVSGRLRGVIALGGVTPETLNLLRNIGFAGAAMLSAAWPLPTPAPQAPSAQ